VPRLLRAADGGARRDADCIRPDCTRAGREAHRVRVARPGLAAVGAGAAPILGAAVESGPDRPAAADAACRELGTIMGSGGGSVWTSSESKMQAAYGRLTSSTQALGGDYALIDAIAGDARGITISGHAYDCSRSPSTAAPSPPAARSGPSVEERLRRLDQLKKDGLITPEEHAAKRRAILDEL